jgi:hypothetical protein
MRRRALGLGPPLALFLQSPTVSQVLLRAPEGLLIHNDLQDGSKLNPAFFSALFSLGRHADDDE